MENSFIIENLPGHVVLTEEEWVELLEEHQATNSAGVESVKPFPAIEGVNLAPAVVVELTLENETEAVIAGLSTWLAARLASLRTSSENSEGKSSMQVQCRPIDMLSDTSMAAIANESKRSKMSYTFNVPIGAAPDLKPYGFHIEIDATASGTGSRLWIGGVMLAEWLWFRHCLDSVGPVAGQVVLELGAGFCGLPSIAAKSTGSSCVIASDGVRCVFQQLARNVVCHGIEAREIRWEIDALNTSEAIDVILFADCLYSEKGAQLLLKCIESGLTSRPNLVVYGTLEPLSRYGCRTFQKGMAELGFLEFQEVIDQELRTLISKKLPRSVCDEEEINGVQLWKWRHSKAQQLS